MQKIDKTVLAETKYIAIWTAILSLVMEAIFLICRKWNYTVLLGNLWGGTFAVVNFLLMGITVQKALLKEEKDAKTALKLSQIYRKFMLCIVMIIGIILPWFNTWAVIIPLFFPRIAIGLRPFLDRREKEVAE